jgi:hypothetical protein
MFAGGTLVFFLEICHNVIVFQKTNMKNPLQQAAVLSAAFALVVAASSMVYTNGPFRGSVVDDSYDYGDSYSSDYGYSDSFSSDDINLDPCEDDLVGCGDGSSSEGDPGDGDGSSSDGGGDLGDGSSSDDGLCPDICNENCDDYDQFECDGGSYSSDDYDGGDYSSDDYDGGDYSSDDYDGGDYSSDDYDGGDYSSDDYDGGSYSSDDYDGGDYSSDGGYYDESDGYFDEYGNYHESASDDGYYDEYGNYNVPYLDDPFDDEYPYSEEEYTDTHNSAEEVSSTSTPMLITETIIDAICNFMRLIYEASDSQAALPIA